MKTRFAFSALSPLITDVDVVNADSASAQKVAGMLNISSPSNTTGGKGRGNLTATKANDASSSPIVGSGAVDTSAATVLAITVTHGATTGEAFAKSVAITDLLQ